MVPMLGSTGTQTRSSFPAMDETSQPIRLLLSVTRDGSRTLGGRESRILSARDPGERSRPVRGCRRRGTWRASSTSPAGSSSAPTRAGRRGLPGAPPRRARPGSPGPRLRGDITPSEPAGPAPPPFDFHPAGPGRLQFPRTAWLRSLREALAGMTSADLGYGDPRGVAALRAAPGGLPRPCARRGRGPGARGGHLGYSRPGDRLPGPRRPGRGGSPSRTPAMPSNAGSPPAGLEIVPVAVDEAGIHVEGLERADVDAVVLAPAHQHPPRRGSWPATGTVLLALAASPRRALEDDYDAEYRYMPGGGPGPPGRAGPHRLPARPARRWRRRSGSAGWWCRGCWTPWPTRRTWTTAGRPASSSRRIRGLPWRAVGSTATCAGCGLSTADGGTQQVEHWPTRSRRRPCAASPPGCTPPSELPDGYRAGHPRPGPPATHRLTTMRDFWVQPGAGPPTLLLGYGRIPSTPSRPPCAKLAEAARVARVASHRSARGRTHRSRRGSGSTQPETLSERGGVGPGEVVS